MDAASCSDPFFLDWGSSVNVNEDLRRTIRAEIEEIESDIQKLHANVKSEEKVANQLTKDFCHARNELMNLSRGASDDKENSIMNEQIQMRLQESLMTEVVAVITPPSSPTGEKMTLSSSHSHVMDGNISPIDTTDKESNNEASFTTERHLGKYLTKCAAEVKSLVTSMRTKKADIEEQKGKIASTQCEINNINNQLDRDQKTVSTWSETVHAKTRESDAEKQRIRSVREGIQRARKLNGHHAQKFAEDSMLLSANKAKNTDIEAKYEAERKSLEDEIRVLSNTMSSLAEDDSTLSIQLDSLTKQFAEREEISAKRDNIKKQYEEKQALIDDSKKKENELKKNLGDMKEALRLKQVELDEYKKQYVYIQNLKAKNDIEEQMVLAPSKVQYTKLQEEKQALAKTITDLHDSNDAEKQALELQKRDNSNLLNKLKTDYEEKLGYVASRKAEIVKLEKLLNESNAVAKKEVEENKKLAMNLNEAIKAQKSINEEKKEQKKRFIRTKLDMTNKLKRKSFEMKLLKRGAEIISKTRELEKEFMPTLRRET